MALNKAQFMEVPGGPGVVGAIKAGSGISIAQDGAISVNAATNATIISQGSGGVVITPSSGVGTVTIAGPFVPPPVPDFPAGTKAAFFQGSAPTGWTKDTSYDNVAMRIVSGTSGGSLGGSNPFSSAFTTINPTGTVNFSSVSWSGSASATALSVAQLAAHTHTFAARGSPSPNSFKPGGGGGTTALNPPVTSSSTGSNSAHTHTVSGSLSGTQQASLDPLNLAVRYVDFIICTKN